MTGPKVPSLGMYANMINAAQQLLFPGAGMAQLMTMLLQQHSLQQGSNLYGHRQPSPSLPSVSTTTPSIAAARRAEYQALPDKGARAGEIIGWRAWLIAQTDQGKVRLRSLTQDVYWEPNEPVHGEPALGYGVFAYCDSLVLGIMAQAEYSHSMLALGSVYLWGAVVEHDRGYRAEWAKIRSIDYTSADHLHIAQTLRLTYGVKSNKELLCQTNQATK